MRNRFELGKSLLCLIVLGFWTYGCIAQQAEAGGDDIVKLCEMVLDKDSKADFVKFGGRVYPVELQPVDDPGFVSDREGVVTDFQLATGAVGLLAHNTRKTGEAILGLESGDSVELCVDNEVKKFVVINTNVLRAITPSSPYSFFEDPESGGIFSAEEVFNMIYEESKGVVFQTCLGENGNMQGSRFFVIADEVK